MIRALRSGVLLWRLQSVVCNLSLRSGNGSLLDAAAFFVQLGVVMTFEKYRSWSIGYELFVGGTRSFLGGAAKLLYRMCCENSNR